jgi:hypothetical protein
MRMSNKKVTLRELDRLGDWKKLMLEKYADGGSDSEVRAELRKLRRETAPKGIYRGFSYSMWQRLMKDEPTFKAVVEEGRDAAKAWWEDKARMAAIGEMKGNPANLIFALKNRVGYTDRQEVKHDGTAMPVFTVIQSDGKQANLSPPKAKAQPQVTKH